MSIAKAMQSSMHARLRCSSTSSCKWTHVWRFSGTVLCWRPLLSLQTPSVHHSGHKVLTYPGLSSQHTRSRYPVFTRAHGACLQQMSDKRPIEKSLALLTANSIRLLTAHVSPSNGNRLAWNFSTNNSLSCKRLLLECLYYPTAVLQNYCYPTTYYTRKLYTVLLDSIKSWKTFVRQQFCRISYPCFDG